LRIVLDTNVLLAGLATHGLCEALLAWCLRDHEVVLSEHILREFAEHYVGKFTASPERAALVVDMLRSHVQVITPVNLQADAFDDPDDLPVLGTAVSATAECLITGDAALLELESFRSVAILSPRAFYDRFGGSA